MTSDWQEPSSTSHSLVLEIQAGDERAWPRFFSLYFPLVYEWCRKFELEEADAADCSQDVMAKLQRKITKFSFGYSGSSFRGWLWTVTRNEVLDFLKKDRLIRATGGTDAHERLATIPDLLPVDENCIDDERTGLKRRALALIRKESDSRTFQAFWRSAVEGESPTQIALDLGYEVNSIFKIRRRYSERIKRDLADFER